MLLNQRMEKQQILSESGYASVMTETESLVSSSVKPTFPSCKSHPITSIQYCTADEHLIRSITETGLDPKMLSHVLSHDACLKKLNEELKLIGVQVKRAERDFCAISVHGETNALVQENKEKMYKIISTFCQEHIVMYDCDVDENRFSLADVKFGKFLEGLNGKVSVFYLDGKMFMIGHEIDIDNFQKNILSSVLNDPVVTESMKLEEEQFVYLKVLKNRFIKYSTDFTLEEENGSFCAKLHGLREDVVNTIRELGRRLEGYREHLWTRQMSKSEYQLMHETRVQRHLRDVLKKNNLSFLTIEDKLHVASEILKAEDFKQRLENELFIETKKSLSGLGKKLFLSDEWTTKKGIVLRNNTKKHVIVMVEGNDLVVTCLPRVKVQADSFIEDFLNENTELEIFHWKCAKETKQFCQRMKQDDLQEIAKTLTDEILSMSVKDDGIYVRGTNHGIREFQKQLYMVVNDSKYLKKEFAAPPDEEIIKHFSNQESQKKLQRIGQKTRCLLTITKPCKISMKEGNIAEEEADVIVNSANTNTRATAGSLTVAGAIFDKGGNTFQKHLIEKTNGRLQTGEVAATEAEGNLRCKAVYHACLPETSSNEKKDVQMMVKNCLEKAERDGHKSISFPALGTGVYNYQGTSSAEGLFDAIVEFSRATVSVDNVSVVLHKQSRDAVKEAFRQEYERRLWKGPPSPLVALKEGCIADGRITIVGESQQNIEEAKKDLETLIAEMAEKDLETLIAEMAIDHEN